jgi:hypothetical protein
MQNACMSAWYLGKGQSVIYFLGIFRVNLILRMFMTLKFMMLKSRDIKVE